VEGDPVTDGRYGALWQGRRYYTEREECLAAFLEDPETYARELEPRAALFAPANPARPAMGVSLLAVALVFVLALLSAGVASYVAVQKGLSGTRWFALGLALNLLAVPLVLTRARRETAFRSEGLTKVPLTYAPERCPGCAELNHPSAARCSACGRPLEPRVESEVARSARA
jgi:YHS domain-containing protein